MFSHIFRHDKFGGGGRERKEKDKVEEKEDKGGRMTGIGFGVRVFCVFISNDGISWHYLFAYFYRKMFYCSNIVTIEPPCGEREA